MKGEQSTTDETLNLEPRTLNLERGHTDDRYVGIPWKDAGSAWDGADCRGLAYLFAAEEFGFRPPVAQSGERARGKATELLSGAGFNEKALQRGDLVFFRRRKDARVCHVATFLGGGKYLHTINGYASRVDNGLALIRRIGLEPVGAIARWDQERFCAALSDADVGYIAPVVQFVIMLVIAIGSTVASILLMPKMPNFRNAFGRYSNYGGFENLMTHTTTQEPLPDVLGNVFLAGNAVYQTGVDKTQAITDVTQQKVNKIVVLASGPVAEDSLSFKINSMTRNSPWFFNGTGKGLAPNPAQTKAEAVTGTIGVDTNRPSVTAYWGDYGIDVEADVRSQYDRNYPVYAFSGCAYLVFRLIDSNKFPSFNIAIRTKGRKCRKITTTGFEVNTTTDESLAGADGTKVRFKLAHQDIKEVTALTVNGTAYAHISAAAQTGNVFYLNKTKGYVEFITAPAAAATILVSYTNYPRDWTQNPALHLVYLLTEPGRGKGFDESRIDWPAAVALRDYCDEIVYWRTLGFSVVGRNRFKCNYALDYRKSLQDHLRAVLDSCMAGLFISNGKLVMKARGAGASVFSFTEANILKDSFGSELVNRSDRNNSIDVVYHSEDSLSAETAVTRDDPENQRARAPRVGNGGVVDEKLYLPAVSSQHQAERIGETILTEQVNTRWMVSFKTSIKGLPLEPFDIVDVTHSSQPAWAGKLFRIEEISHDEDDRMEIVASEYFEGAYL